MSEGRALMEAAVAITEGTKVYIDTSGRATNVATSATFVGICDEPSSGAGADCSIDLRLGSGA
jgi:predicted RecA/RadA family phage recombinase